MKANIRSRPDVIFGIFSTAAYTGIQATYPRGAPDVPVHDPAGRRNPLNIRSHGNDRVPCGLVGRCPLAVENASARSDSGAGASSQQVLDARVRSADEVDDRSDVVMPCARTARHQQHVNVAWRVVERVRGVHGKREARVLGVQAFVRRLHPYGIQGLGNEGQVQLSVEGAIEQRVQRSEDVDRVEGVEERDGPVLRRLCWLTWSSS